jgi:hypothetical protein
LICCVPLKKTPSLTTSVLEEHFGRSLLKIRGMNENFASQAQPSILLHIDGMKNSRKKPFTLLSFSKGNKTDSIACTSLATHTINFSPNGLLEEIWKRGDGGRLGFT